MVDARGRRATAATLAVVVVAVDAWLAACTHGTVSHSGGGAQPTASVQHAKAAQPTLPAAESGLLPWHMAAPLSREVVTGSPGRLVVFGGLTVGGASANGVYRVLVINENHTVAHQRGMTASASTTRPPRWARRTGTLR